MKEKPFVHGTVLITVQDLATLRAQLQKAEQDLLTMTGNAERERLDKEKAEQEVERLRGMIPPEGETLVGALRELQADYDQVYRDKQHANERREKYRVELFTLQTAHAALASQHRQARELLGEVSAAMDNLAENLPGTYNGYLRDTHTRIRAHFNSTIAPPPKDAGGESDSEITEMVPKYPPQ